MQPHSRNGSATKNPTAAILRSRDAAKTSSPYSLTVSPRKTKIANVIHNCHGKEPVTSLTWVAHGGGLKNRFSPLTGSQNSQGKFALSSQGTPSHKRRTTTSTPDFLNDTPPGVAGTLERK